MKNQTNVLRKGLGGRKSSHSFRHSLQQSADFLGLDQDIRRYDLLLLVKRVGKYAGFSARMIALLDYYISFTRDCDWEEGSRPVIYQCLSKTALDMGVTERQIQKLENALFECGALTWHDSGNHRRFGKRDEKTGRILYAYGVDLSPLAALQALLQQKLEEKQLYDAAWMETKRQISWYRSQIRSISNELLEKGEEGASESAKLSKEYESISMQIRTHMDLHKLREILKAHKALHESALKFVGHPEKTEKGSSKNVQKFAINKNTNNKQSDKSDHKINEDDVCKRKQHLKPANKELTLSERMISAKLHQIKIRDLSVVLSERAMVYLGHHTQLTMQDFVEIAYKIKGNLSISQNKWIEACEVLGREGAALSVLLTDFALDRSCNPVSKPAGYFSALIERARVGDLNLKASLEAILSQKMHENVLQ
nr:hypothetical protein [Cytophagales bacterium]